MCANCFIHLSFACICLFFIQYDQVLINDPNCTVGDLIKNYECIEAVPRVVELFVRLDSTAVTEDVTGRTKITEQEIKLQRMRYCMLLNEGETLRSQTVLSSL